MVWLTGRLCRLYDDVPDGRCGQKYDHVDLFNVGRKWWLSYGKKQNTGSFPTKRAAKAWIDNGGRQASILVEDFSCIRFPFLYTNDMKTHYNPTVSRLGVEKVQHEVVESATGVLAVTFRYVPEDLSNLDDGLQMQFETIAIGTSRGGHYHYPEDAYESFFVLEGHCDLIVCDLQKEVCEVYAAEHGLTYRVPGMIAHKATNTSPDTEVKMVVAKPFNFKIINRTEMFDMSWTEELEEMEQMEQVEEMA